MPTHDECNQLARENSARERESALQAMRITNLESNYAEIRQKLEELHDDMIKRNTIIGATMFITTGMVSAGWAVFNYFIKGSQ